HAGLEDELRPAGDVLGRLDVRVLHVDHADRDIASRVGDLAQELDFAHLAVRELEDELLDLEAEHGLEDRAIGSRRERAAEKVAEAEVRPEPGPAASR